MYIITTKTLIGGHPVLNGTILPDLVKAHEQYKCHVMW